MVYSNTTDNNGLIQDLELRLFSEDYGTISGSTTRMQTFTNLLNRALDRLTYELISYDNTWRWDDYNNTDFPDARTNLISGQNDYALAVSHLTLKEVTVFNSSGDEYKLRPVDEMLYTQPLEEMFESSGTPRYYKLEGNSIFLYPAPDYNYTEGLKIKTQRPHAYFATSDTTKTPGFAPIFHYLVSLMAAFDYATINMLDNRVALGEQVQLGLRDLRDYMLKRNNNRISRIIPKLKFKK